VVSFISLLSPASPHPTLPQHTTHTTSTLLSPGHTNVPPYHARQPAHSFPIPSFKPQGSPLASPTPTLQQHTQHTTHTTSTLLPMFLHVKHASLLLDGVAIGGGAACGALLRYGATKVQEHYKCGPWAIPVINMAGSFVLGALSVSSQVDPRVKLMVGVGFCGT